MLMRLELLADITQGGILIGNIGKFYNYYSATLLTSFLEIVQNNCENTIWKKTYRFEKVLNTGQH